MATIHGVCLRWGVNANRCVVVNVYSPYQLVDKRRLWEEIIMSKRGFGSCLWCIVGDFNTVRRQDERKRVIGEYGARDMEEFNLFIRDMELIDIPLVGKRFTWFKSDDSMMSRLDRVLVSESWSAQWGVGYVEVHTYHNIFLWLDPSRVTLSVNFHVIYFYYHK
uniref:Endonuclease/exonuclease/phosphatase domain-containing protein n=1 Tax=Cajanus cajan TaxID=3821 RepID=A0A151U6G4_CAJCA|nr:hypothetical protein KK1_007599 [Cajanus cajan]